MNQLAVFTVFLALSFSLNAGLCTWIVTGRTTASTLQRLSTSGVAVTGVFGMFFLVVQTYR